MSTETVILDAAERLFATQGIAGTSLRQISGAAHQRNTAAVHYHFGDKDALIRAIIRHRREIIEVRRRELLAPIEADTGTWPVVEALVRPLAEQAVRPGSHYVRFLKRLYEHVGQDVDALAGTGDMDDSVATGKLVSDRLPPMSRARSRARGRWSGQLIVSAAADLEHGFQDGTIDDPEDFTRGLIDALTGLLTAPSTAPE